MNFMDFTRGPDRRELTNKLQEAGARIEIMFQKDDGAMRRILATLDPAQLTRNLQPGSQINTPRSVFIKVYDLVDKGLKTIRWSRIVNIAVQKPINNNQGIAKQVRVSVPEPTKPPVMNSNDIMKSVRASSELIKDLQLVGFVHGKPINDAMLIAFAKLREDRAVAEATGALRTQLSNVLGKLNAAREALN